MSNVTPLKPAQSKPARATPVEVCELIITARQIASAVRIAQEQSGVPDPFNGDYSYAQEQIEKLLEDASRGMEFFVLKPGEYGREEEEDDES